MNKKPVWAALGLAGACAACCAIPLALPLWGSLAAVGLAGLGVGAFADWPGLALVAALLGMMAVSGLVLWWRSRLRRVAARAAAPAACKIDCGCARAG